LGGELESPGGDALMATDLETRVRFPAPPPCSLIFWEREVPVGTRERVT
jgi:hypothetical protein